MTHDTYMKYELKGALWHGNALCFIHGSRDHNPHVAGGVIGAMFARREYDNAIG